METPFTPIQHKNYISKKNVEQSSFWNKQTFIQHKFLSSNIIFFLFSQILKVFKPIQHAIISMLDEELDWLAPALTIR